MNPKLISSFGLCLLLRATAFGQLAMAQVGPQYSAQGASALRSQGGPVSYASVTQLNGLLAQLDATRRRRRPTWRSCALSAGRPTALEKASAE